MHSESGIAVAAPAIDRRPEVALALTALIGEYSLLIMPFILVAMMQTDSISEASAGRLVSLQLLFMAIASALVSTRLRPGRSVRPILAGAALLIVLANTACALLHDPVAL